jgi:carboxypeptidase Taq
MSDSLTQLKARLGQLADLSHVISLAHWDQQTMMPPRGARARADALATISRLRHELASDPEIGRLAHAAAEQLPAAAEQLPAPAGQRTNPAGQLPTPAGQPPSGDDSDDDRLLAHVIRRWEKTRRVPPELAAARARAASAGQEAWVVARRTSDFASFAGRLTENIDLARRYVECQMGSGEYATGYDVLLDDFEPGMTTARVSDLFGQLRAGISRLIERVGAGAADLTDDTPLDAVFAVDRQRALVAEVLAMMGFDPGGWRMDDTVHPFASRIGSGDVRLTTRFDERWFPMSLFGAMHECGHGLYEDGVPPALDRSPLGVPESLALHESQSRLWENCVGRGRPFCEVLAPRIAALGGGRLADTTPDRLYRAVNRVRPSFIRVEADETTYALHIILRFELERDLIDGSLKVADLPDAWNERFHELLGLTVTDDANGVLQDVHWSAGLIGYFPTYALGNLVAGHLWQRARADLGGLDEQLRSGRLGALREWLREHVHRHGAKFSADELLTREVGRPMEVGPLLGYLEDKLGDVYGSDLTPEPAPTSER